MFRGTERITVDNKQYTVDIRQEGEAKVNPGLSHYVGTCLDIPGAISQGKTSEELISNMVDCILLLERKAGNEPKGFWIRRTIPGRQKFPEKSWQSIVQLLESNGYRLRAETQKHKHLTIRAANTGGDGAYLGYTSSVAVPVQDPLADAVIEFIKQRLRNNKKR